MPFTDTILDETGLQCFRIMGIFKVLGVSTNLTDCEWPCGARLCDTCPLNYW